MNYCHVSSTLQRKLLHLLGNLRSVRIPCGGGGGEEDKVENEDVDNLNQSREG